MTSPPTIARRSLGSSFLIRLFGRVVHLSILALCYLISLLNWLGQRRKTAGQWLGMCTRRLHMSTHDLRPQVDTAAQPDA